MPFAQVQQDGQGCWGEADGVLGHTPLQGRLVQVHGGVDGEGEDETSHEGLQHLQQSWHGERIAGGLFEPVGGPVQGAYMAHSTDVTEENLETVTARSR